MFRQNLDLSLYLVLGSENCKVLPPEEVAAEALRGGITCLQLREKSLPKEQVIALGKRLKALLEGSGVPLIINDSLELVAAIGADGVHLGAEDVSAAEARALLGPKAIVGVTAGTPEEVAAVDASLADYAGCGPFYASPTKADAGAALGVEGFAALRAKIPLPVVAIGGIAPGRAAAPILAGADGVAVVSALTGSEDPKSVARALKQEVVQALVERKRV
jgi:thiamine-phosphate pyrophosphorylase